MNRREKLLWENLIKKVMRALKISAGWSWPLWLRRLSPVFLCQTARKILWQPLLIIVLYIFTSNVFTRIVCRVIEATTVKWGFLLPTLLYCTRNQSCVVYTTNKSFPWKWAICGEIGLRMTISHTAFIHKLVHTGSFKGWNFHLLCRLPSSWSRLEQESRHVLDLTYRPASLMSLTSRRQASDSAAEEQVTLSSATAKRRISRARQNAVTLESETDRRSYTYFVYLDKVVKNWTRVTQKS